MTIEETEQLITQLRDLAVHLNTAADALQASLTPLKVIKDAQDKFLQAQKDLADTYGLPFFDYTKLFTKS